MDNNSTKYLTQAIDPAILSVFDVNAEGKVVSAETWKTLWELVIKHINKIDAYCVDLEDIKTSWESSEQELEQVIAEFNEKYNGLVSSFIHYGTEAPTNPHIRLWVQPVEDLPTIITNDVLDEVLESYATKAWVTAEYATKNSFTYLDARVESINTSLSNISVFLANNIYTKSEILRDFYTKTHINNNYYTAAEVNDNFYNILQIDSKEDALKTRVHQLEIDSADEHYARIDADSALQQRINSVSSQITSEAAARQAADGALESQIPTKTSDLTNDSGFITNTDLETRIEDGIDASNVTYDNTLSDLESTNVKNALDEIVTKFGSVVKVESWEDVLKVINSGLASKVFKVGEQLECGHTKYGTLVWDITDVTPEKLSLCVHKCPVFLQFDAREALYYAETELAAGTYNFTIVTQPWYTADNGKTFQFTLTKPVPQGGQIVLNATHDATLAGRSVKTYSGGDSTTVIETATITEGSEGTAFGKTDGSVANVNHILRALAGSNNYKESAIRQWLNSDGAAGTFWTPQTVFDRPPSWETNTAGFINGLDADFLAVISDTTYDVRLNSVTDGGGKETLTDKFVLLSRDEIYAGSEGGVTLGEPLPYFSEFSDHNSPSTAEDSNRIKTNASGTAIYWWLRSPYTSLPNPVRFVTPSGSIYLNHAYNSYGVAPACNIIKNQ